MSVFAFIQGKEPAEDGAGWFDMRTLIQDHNFTVADIHDIFERVGNPMGFSIAMQRLCSGKPQAGDPGLAPLVERPPSADELAVFFKTKRNEFETQRASDVDSDVSARQLRKCRLRALIAKAENAKFNRRRQKPCAFLGAIAEHLGLGAVSAVGRTPYRKRTEKTHGLSRGMNLLLNLVSENKSGSRAKDQQPRAE